MRMKRTSLGEIPEKIDAALLKEIHRMFPEFNEITDLNECLIELVRKTGTKIIFVIDEWDSIIREAQKDEETQESYLNLLRGWFKNNNFTSEAVAAAYMTGILPIKRMVRSRQSLILLSTLFLTRERMPSLSDSRKRR